MANASVNGSRPCATLEGKSVQLTCSGVGEIRAGGESPRPGRSQQPVDQVELLDRRSKSGWEEARGSGALHRSRGVARRSARPGVRDPTGGERCPPAALSSPRCGARSPWRPRPASPPAQPAGRLRAARTGRRGARRGLAPRRRLAARRGRRAPACRCRGSGRHRGRHAGALRPHRPHGAVLAGAGRGRRTPRGLRPARPQPRRGGGAATLREAGVEVEGGLLEDEARAVAGPGRSPWTTAGRSSPGSSPPPWTAAAPHPTAPAAGCPPARPASTRTACGRCATPCWSAPTPSTSTTRCSPSATPTTSRS